MDLVFNELSVLPLATDKTKAFARVDQFLLTFKHANEFEYNRIRFHTSFNSIELSKNYFIENYCSEPKNRTKATLLRGLFRFPFIDENSEEENRYIQNYFYLEKGDKRIETYGLAVAYLYSTLGIGFCSEPFWNNSKFQLITITDEIASNDIVFCVSKPNHFDDDDLKTFIENNTPLQLIKTNIDPKTKSINLRDDHGKDVLLKFSKKIVNSPYIIEIINSIPYNPHNNEFIRKIYPNGNIEIVLTKTDKGLGIVVKTTGRNKHETEAIADILERLFKK
jgi:hypothetical protein